MYFELKTYAREFDVQKVLHTAQKVLYTAQNICRCVLCLLIMTIKVELLLKLIYILIETIHRGIEGEILQCVQQTGSIT